MNPPEPGQTTYSTLVSDIEKGLIKIPQFQRQFVWPREKVARLLDSVIKGYPIGTFILWKTKEELRSIRNLGNIALPRTPKGDFIQYVLDGQQRLTSLFAALKGLKITRDGIEEDFADLWIDLDASEHDQIVTTNIDEKSPKSVIRLVELIEGGAKRFATYGDKYAGRLDELRDRIRTYNFSTILVRDTDIDVATEIFTRLNVGGKPLTVFEIMVAKTFDADRNFDLAERYKELIDELREVGYETISDATVLQTISSVLVGECQRKHILGLRKSEVVDAWQGVINAIHHAIDYFRGSLQVPVSKLLPYNGLLVPLAYFFHKHPKKPVGNTQRLLHDFFWRTSLSGRYSFALESKLAQDIKRVDTIVKGESPEYDYSIDISPKFVIENGYFSASRSYVKAILCVYVANQPRSFSDDSVVRVSNDWLKQANSRNYHHFFPKSYMGKSKPNVDWNLVNNVVNITIVDDYLNKREIGTQPPSKYIRKFAKENSNLGKTLRSHLIKADRYGVWDDDFESFISGRARWISRELQKRLIPRDVDQRGQVVNLEDVDEYDLDTVESN